MLGRGENVLVCTGDGYKQDVLVLLLFGRARKWLGSESVTQVPSLSPEDVSYIFWAHCKLFCQHQPVEATWKDSREPAAAMTRLWVWTLL